MTLARLLNRYVERPADRALFNLPPRNTDSDNDQSPEDVDKTKAASA